MIDEYLQAKRGACTIGGLSMKIDKDSGHFRQYCIQTKGISKQLATAVKLICFFGKKNSMQVECVMPSAN